MSTFSTRMLIGMPSVVHNAPPALVDAAATEAIRCAERGIAPRRELASGSYPRLTALVERVSVVSSTLV